MRPLSESVSRIAGSIFSRKYIMLGRLVTRWGEIVGPELAAQCQPVKIKKIRTKSDKTESMAALEIAANPSHATLLHYKKDLILERINQIFGERLIDEIRLVPGGAANSDIHSGKSPPPRPLTLTDEKYLSETLDAVADKAIQERLRRLGAAMLQDKKRDKPQ